MFFPSNTFKTLDEALLIYSKVFKYCGIYEKGTAQWGGPINSLEKKSWREEVLNSDLEIFK